MFGTLSVASARAARYYILIAALLAIVAFWSTIAHSAVPNEDPLVSYARAMGNFEHWDALRTARETIAHYTTEHSGISAVGALPVTAWLIDPFFRVQEALALALITALLVMLAAAVRDLSGSRGPGLFSAIVAIVCWQVRHPHDVLLQLDLPMMWCAALALSSLFCWARYARTQHSGWLVACAVVSALSSASSVVGFALTELLALYAISQARSVRVRIFFACLAAGLALVAAPLFLPKLDLASPVSVFHQAIAALPTSYRAAGDIAIGHEASLWHAGSIGPRYSDDRFTTISEIGKLAWPLVVALAAGAFAVLFLAQGDKRTRTLRALGMFGLVWWLVPTLFGDRSMWSTSGLPLGYAYPAIIFCYIGVAMFLTSLIYSALNSKLARVVPYLTALAVFFVAYGNARATGVELSRIARIDASRAILARAGSAGYFSAIPDGLRIALIGTPPFSAGSLDARRAASYMLFEYSGRRYRVESSVRSKSSSLNALGFFPTHPAMPLRAFDVTSVRNNEEQVDRAVGFSPMLDDWRNGAHARGVSYSVSRLRDGVIVRATRLCGSVPASVAFGDDRPTFVPGAGLFPPGPGGYFTGSLLPQYFEGNPIGSYAKMYMSKTADATIIPSRCSPTSIVAWFTVIAAGAGTLTIDRSDGIRSRVELSDQPLRFALRLRDDGKPVHLHFRTTAPPSTFNSSTSRYEKDVPRDIRVMIEPETIQEDLPQ